VRSNVGDADNMDGRRVEPLEASAAGANDGYRRACLTIRVGLQACGVVKSALLVMIPCRIEVGSGEVLSVSSLTWFRYERSVLSEQA